MPPKMQHCIVAHTHTLAYRSGVVVVVVLLGREIDALVKTFQVNGDGK